MNTAALPHRGEGFETASGRRRAASRFRFEPKKKLTPTIDTGVDRRREPEFAGVGHSVSSLMPSRGSPCKSALGNCRLSGALLFPSNERANPFRKKCCVEWFSESFVEQRAVETTGVVIVAQ